MNWSNWILIVIFVAFAVALWFVARRYNAAFQAWLDMEAALRSKPNLPELPPCETWYGSVPHELQGENRRRYRRPTRSAPNSRR